MTDVDTDLRLEVARIAHEERLAGAHPGHHAGRARPRPPGARRRRRHHLRPRSAGGAS